MSASHSYHRPLGKTGLLVPPIIFRGGVLDNSVPLPEQTKRVICGEWLKHVTSPLAISFQADNIQSGSIRMVGDTLRRLDVPPHDVLIIFEFDLAPGMRELSQSHEFYLRFDDAGHLLGAPYAPSLITLNTTGGMLELRPFHEVLRRWADQNSSTRKFAMGITVSRSSELDTIPNVVELGYVHLKHGPNILDHSAHRVEQIKCLAEQEVGVISSNVFAGGFLVGGRGLNGRTIDPDTRADESLVAWRKAFTALCHGHGVRPAHACIQYALSIPGVAAVSLSTSNAERVVEAVHAATTPVPSNLWISMIEDGLIAPGHGGALSS